MRTKKGKNNALAYQVRSKAPVAVETIDAPSGPAAPDAITILELEEDHCKFPGNTIPQAFCGAQRIHAVREEGRKQYFSPYCVEHHRVCFRAQ